MMEVTMSMIEWIVGSIASIALGISIGTLVILCIVLKHRR